MKHVFLDTDIVLDLLQKRQPFAEPAARLFSQIEQKKLRASLSPLTVANTYYVLRRGTSSREALRSLRLFLNLVAVIPMTQKTVDLALLSGFRDFEDALQYYTALDQGLEVLLTRNKKDYKNASIPIMTAAEFLEEYDESL